MKKKIIIKAMIAVRSGSERVKNKNLKPFAGSNLLENKIRQLKRLDVLDGVVVNSNDDMMLEIARSHNCEAIKRDSIYASNTISMSEVYVNMAEHCDADVIVYANCTNPLLKDDTLYEAIELFKKSHEVFDSLNSGHLIKEFMFRDNKPINYDLLHQPRSQDLPDISALNFAINIISRADMIECKNVVGKTPYIFNIDEIEATDIDNPLDFEFAEYVFKRGIW